MGSKKKKLIWAIVAIVLVLAIVAALVITVLDGSGGGRELKAEQTSEKVKTTNKKVEAQEDYVLVAESDTYKMYYYEPCFSIKLENKQTGAVLESTLSDEKDDGLNNKSWTGYMKSGIVMTAIIGTTNTYQVDMLTCKNTITTYYTENGIFAEISFPKYQFSLGIEVSLIDDELVVRIPDYTIKENKEGTYISTVSIFPFLGYTYLGEENGYMLVPDGNGALIYLEDKEGRYSTGFSRLIYGIDEGMTSNSKTSQLWDTFDMVTDANNVMAPIFGMAHTDDELAYLAIVESGDERCSIECQPNGVMVNYNRCFAKFLLRDVFIQPLNNSNSGTVKTVETDRMHSDLQVRYCLLSGEDADYSGMANTYREYLLDNELINVVGSGYNTRVDFLGVEQEEFLMGTTDVTMTTVADIEEIYTQLQEAGVDSLISVYKGWQNGGLYDYPISKYKADGSIGSTGALTDLIAKQEEKGYGLYLYNDGLLVNDATNATTFNVMKMINKRTYKLETNGDVYDLFYYLLPSKAHSGLSNFVTDYTAEGVNNLALAGISDTLFSYSSKGSFYSRTDTQASFVKTIEAVNDRCDLLLETPNAYLWKYTDAFLDMPLGSSDYLYVDQDIPFLSMVMKGIVPMYSKYVNFEANKTKNFLQMVEAGVYPSFYVAKENSSMLIYTNSCDLYSLEFSSYSDTIIKYDQEMRELAQLTGDANIIRHEVADDGLVTVTYSNGVVIYINYTDKDWNVAEGLTVEKLSYKVGEAE